MNTAMTDELNEDERAMVELVRDFVNREVRPAVRELEHANTYPDKLIEQMKQLGIYGLAIPEPWGDAQVSTPCYAQITEELSRGWMSLAGAMGGHTVVAKLLLAYGTDEQKDAYLPRMATGELRATMALTEPGGGSDLQAMRTSARRDGDGYVISGSKMWITNARRSGLTALLCKTDPAAKPAHAGISIILAEPGPGFTVSRDLPKLGYKGVESCELAFEDYRVPASALLGGREGEGFGQMMRGLEIGRIQVAARALGVGQAALDDSLRYAQQREAFGVPIWKHQSIGNYLADMVTKLTAARQLVMYAARCYDSGRRADMEVGMAKLFASETAMEIALNAVRIHGGYGYSTEFDVERYFRDAPLMIVGEGTNEIQRNVIARQLIQRHPAAGEGVTVEPGGLMSGSSSSALPLDGLLVVALEQAVAAPFATRQLADLGARVIKIERAGAGDFARGYDTSVLGQASYFVWLNRGKESVELDVKSAGGQQAMAALLARADVFVQNLAPGAAARLGLGASDLLARHPRLICCSVSGYGPDGPYAGKKAYDLLVQCEAGLLSVTGTPEAPCKAGISVADIAAGMYAYSGVLTALYERERTGRGSSFEVSLLDALGEWMSQPYLYTVYGDREVRRTGARHASISPYGPYQARGGEVFIGLQNEREWAVLCERVLGRPDLIADTRFATNPDRVKHDDELTEIIEGVLGAMAPDEVVARLDTAGIASARLRTPAEFAAHPQLEARDRWREAGTPAGPVRALLPPVTVPGREAAMGAVPALGEHTESVLAEFLPERTPS